MALDHDQNDKIKMSKVRKYPGDARDYLVTPIPGDTKHTKSKCMAKVHNTDGILCSCTFEARTDHVINAIKTGKQHTCKAGKPIGSVISDFFSKSDSDTGADSFTAKALQEKLVTFIGRKNISMTVGSSDEIYELLAYAFACGAMHGKRSNPIESANNFIPRLKRDALTDLFITTANKLHENAMKLFAADKMPYVSVALDEGSTMSRKLLDFCLENPEYPTISYPGTTIRMQDTTFESYNTAIVSGLREMDSYNITFAALIIDGGKGQEKALNHKDPSSLFNRCNIKWIKKLLVIPCICHRTNNAFKTACTKTDAGLNKMADFIHSLPDRINEHTREIGATCPRHMPTRWTCDFFIADFVVNHKDKVSQYIILPEEFFMFYEVSRIFYALIQIFEDPKCSLSSVCPVIKDAFAALDELDEKGNIFALIFKNSLDNYTLGSKTKGIWSLAYMFTPKGREETKSQLITSGYYARPRTIQNFYVKKRLRRDALDEGIEELIHDQVTEISDIDTDDVIDSDIGMTSVNPYNIITPLPPGTIVDETPDPNPIDLERNLSMQRGSLASAGIEYLKEALLTIQCPPSLIDNQITLFKEFLYSNVCTLPMRVTQTGHSRFDWPLIRVDYGGEWRFLADLALRLESCTASEASCERTITAQRLILTAHTLRSDKKLLKARLTYLKGFEK